MEALLDEEPKGRRYKICMSNKDVGATMDAYMSALKINKSVGRVRESMTFGPLSTLLKAKDHQNEAKMYRIVRLAHSFDHYFCFNITRYGPFFPPQNEEHSFEMAISYAANLKGYTFLDLEVKTAIPSHRIKMILSRRANSSRKYTMLCYETALLGEAVGLQAYIMPMVGVVNRPHTISEVRTYKKRTE